MKTIMQLAAEAFYAEPTKLDLWDTCLAHTVGKHSYIVRSDKVFVLAREVPPGWTEEAIIDQVRHSQSSDHLHVTLVAGDLRELIKMIPDHIITISFQKHGYHLHCLRMDKLKARLGV